MKPTQVVGRATFEFNGDVPPEKVAELLPEGWIVTDVTRHQEYVELSEFGKQSEEASEIPGYEVTAVGAKFIRDLRGQ